MLLITRLFFVSLYLMTGSILAFFFGVILGPVFLFLMAPYSFWMGWDFVNTLVLGTTSHTFRQLLTTDPMQEMEIPRAKIERQYPQ